MEVPISEAQDRLDELVSRAQAGEEIRIVLDGRVAVRLEAITQKFGAEPVSPQPYADEPAEASGTSANSSRV